jgi:predicted dehydrogenase
MQHTRRTFLKSAAATTIALGAAPVILRGADDKAAERHTTALVGCGWWGTHILKCALADGRAKAVALCDVDQAQIRKCQGIISKATSDSPKTYGDYREMLEREKPQLVIVGTPDHWHPLITIAAVKAGAHVYVEKPISHTVLEGAAMVKAARAADRVVQVGTHRPRLAPQSSRAARFIRSGKVGKIGAIKVLRRTPAAALKKPRPTPSPPKDLDWDMYCGPAPLAPRSTRRSTPSGHRHFLDFANGQLGDWGIHWIDQALWITDAKHPRTVFSTGGRPVKGAAINTSQEQTTDAPDHQVATYSFEDFTLTWEHRQFGGDPTLKHAPSASTSTAPGASSTSAGRMDGRSTHPMPRSRSPHEDSKLTGENQDNVAELWRDFVDAIEKKRPPACDIEAGHRATTAALLGMLSLKLGRSIKWDGDKQTILDDPQAVALLQRPYRAPWQYPNPA